MNEIIAAILNLSKMCRIERVTGSRIVSRTPGYIFGIHVCPEDGTAVYEAELYDGVNALEDCKLDFDAQYGMDRWISGVPLYFGRGLYVACTTNIKSVTIQYLSIKE